MQQLINEGSRRAREALPAGELSDAHLQAIVQAELSDRYHGLDRRRVAFEDQHFVVGDLC